MASTVSDISGGFGKIVILGASGRLGRILTHCWPSPASLICHSRRAHPGYVAFDLVHEPEKAARMMQDAQAVICLSGVTPAQAQRSGDAMRLNVDLALAAVRAAQRAGAGRVFLASSAAVYGRAEGIQTESAVCTPVSDYGHAKLEMERAALKLARDIDHPATVLRIGNVAGADAILGGWQAGMQIDQLSDGTTPRRSYIGPKTLTRVIHHLTQEPELPDILNIAAPGAVAMGALLDAADLKWAPRPASDAVIAQVELSTKLLERHIEFAPQDSTGSGMVAEWRDVAAEMGNP